MVFTIENSGFTDLSITSVLLTAGAVGEFSIDTASMASPVSVGGSTTFTVTFSPTGTGIISAVVTIANSDPDESSFTFDVTGTGA